jgi:hypothetical protein
MFKPAFVSADDEGPCAVAAERRTAVRYRCSGTAFCPLYTEDYPSENAVRVRDVSLAGIGLLVDRRFAPGTMLVLTPEQPNGRGALVLSARVVHATQRCGSEWLVGCLFARPLSDEALKALRAY